MKPEPYNDGPARTDRLRIDAAQAPSWPVLARVPLVGTQSPATGIPLPSYATLESVDEALRQGHASSSLRIADHDIDAAAATARQLASRRDALPGPPKQATREQRYVGYHVAQRTSEARQNADDRGADHLSRPTSVFQRIDPGQPTPGRPLASGAYGSQSLIARIYRWQSGLAPHVGALATVALILAASFLYWLTFGKPRASLEDKSFLTAPDSWSSEISPASPTAAHEPPPEDAADGLSRLTDPPRVADATVASAPPPKPELKQADASAPAAAATAAPQGVPAAAPQRDGNAANPLGAAESVTPTPVSPSTSGWPYPTTPFTDFGFEKTAADQDAPKANKEGVAPGAAVGPRVAAEPAPVTSDALQAR